MEWPEITIDTPLSEVQEIHKRIWDYAIEHERKPDAPYAMNCALCEYAKQVELFLGIHKEGTCAYCPHKDADLEEECLGGMYYKWLSFRIFGGKEMARVCANKIRDIEFEDEGYWEKRKMESVKED